MTKKMLINTRSGNLILPEKAFIKELRKPFIEHISYMRCGSYTSEWVATVMGYDNRMANLAISGPVWKDYFRPILPMTILGLLHSRGIEGVSTSLDVVMPAQQKIDWLRREIVLNKKPIVILIKATTLHWIVVAGYDNEKEIFYVYDPNFGETSVNSDVPIGNKEIDYHRLLELWEGRWYFRYTLITILNKHQE